MALTHPRTQVMGGYKDDRRHGTVKPSDAPRVGTALNDPAAAQRAGDAVAYAAAKLAAERLLAALAHVRPRTVFLALRVGWCQPGINSPRTIGASGVPPAFETAGAAASVEEDSGDDAWFRGMWLSNGDFLRLFGAAALSSSVPRSAPASASMAWGLSFDCRTGRATTASTPCPRTLMQGGRSTKRRPSSACAPATTRRAIVTPAAFEGPLATIECRGDGVEVLICRRGES